MTIYEILYSIFEPFMDTDRLNQLFCKNYDEYLRVTKEMKEKYGIGTPLIENAPEKAVEALEEYGKLWRNSQKNGSFGGPM